MKYYILATCQLSAISRESPTSDPEGDHMKWLPYAPVVASLMYVMVVTQPDIAHVVGVISRLMHSLS